MSVGTSERPALRLALPKGRMESGVMSLLADAGVKVSASNRGYRPTVSLAGVEAKILKPQNIIEMLAAGSRDVGFAGADWVEELGFTGKVVELLDTGLDNVRLVAAAPVGLVRDGKLPTDRKLVVASEFSVLTQRWIAARGLDAEFVKSFGATEVFPPDDADCIVDIAASGATLAANGLVVVDELTRSSTRLYANAKSLERPETKRIADQLVILLRSVLEARRRVMMEVNVTKEKLEGLVKVLPCMREPTIATLHGGGGYAVKAAVPKDKLPELIPAVRAAGGTDIVVSTLTQIVP